MTALEWDRIVMGCEQSEQLERWIITRVTRSGTVMLCLLHFLLSGPRAIYVRRPPSCRRPLGGCRPVHPQGEVGVCVSAP